jgi:hypothetical protein
MGRECHGGHGDRGKSEHEDRKVESHRIRASVNRHVAIKSKMDRLWYFLCDKKDIREAEGRCGQRDRFRTSEGVQNVEVCQSSHPMGLYLHRTKVIKVKN